MNTPTGATARVIELTVAPNTCFWELLLCPQNVKLVWISWINNIGGQIYVAVPVEGVGEDGRPLSQWQRHIGALQQHIGAIRWAIGRSKCQRRSVHADAG